MNKRELPKDFKEPVLLRASVAKILNCTPLTISNREAKGIYTAPVRDASNKYRKYTVLDVFRMQAATYDGKIFLQPIISVLYDKGYTDVQALTLYVEDVISRFNLEIAEMYKPLVKET